MRGSVSESGRLCHGAGGPEGGGRCRRGLVLATLQDTDLAVPLVHVDANMVHGGPLPSCGIDRGVLLWGSLCHHVEREASRFITSMRPLRVATRCGRAQRRVERGEVTQ